jgi:hypothetical protein
MWASVGVPLLALRGEKIVSLDLATDGPQGVEDSGIVYDSGAGVQFQKPQ